MRNLKLLEKYQPPPPRHQRKRKFQSTRKRKNITPRKSFNHPKIASTIMKKTQTPHLKILNFSKNPNSIGKFFNTFEVARPINPSRKNLNPSRKNVNPSRKNVNPSQKNVNPASRIIPYPKNSQPHPKKYQPGPPKNCQLLPKKCHLYRKNLTPHPQNNNNPP